MLYRKQNDFDKFRCIADKCPMNCCSGWQIVIDDKSLEKYNAYSGEFQKRLHSGIDFSESCFKQNNGRCSMLAESGLCDLQSNLGEEYLCDTCRLYPRHTEEFLDLREYSLSLSCPEVVRILLESKQHLSIEETEDDSEDDIDDYEDFDLFLFDKLTYAREQMLKVVKRDDISLQKKMDIIASAAFTLQGCYDEGEFTPMDDVTYKDVLPDGDNPRHGYNLFSNESTASNNNFSAKDNRQNMLDLSNQFTIDYSFKYMCESLELLLNLEELYPSWHDILEQTKIYWNKKGPDSSEWNQTMNPKPAKSFIFEKMLESLLFTYFCGSIYDGEIYARAMIAVMTVRWIMMISAADTGLTFEETVYLFSREVEHSDLNLNALIKWFEAELE